MSKRWIITGANGYLGNEICQGLCKRGEMVCGLARPGRALNNLEEIGISCHSYADLPAILAEGDILIHCAGKVSFNGVWDEFVKTNIEWTVALFNQAVKSGASCFIFISSVAALGYKNRSKDEIIEETSLPSNSKGDLYGRSKWIAEQKLQERAKASSTRLIILRPGLIYGRRSFSNAQTWLRRGVVIALDQRLPLGHIDNLVEAIFKVVEKRDAEGLFLVVDDEQPALRDLNALKIKLGVLKYHPWRIGKLGFWLLHFFHFVLRHIYGRGGYFQKGYGLAQYRLHTRQLLYSSDKLRRVTGWEPQINLIDGIAGCLEFYRKTKRRSD
jgi:nucleoside-diphosphate-sugar epimerase